MVLNRAIKLFTNGDGTTKIRWVTIVFCILGFLGAFAFNKIIDLPTSYADKTEFKIVESKINSISKDYIPRSEHRQDLNQIEKDIQEKIENINKGINRIEGILMKVILKE